MDAPPCDSRRVERDYPAVIQGNMSPSFETTCAQRRTHAINNAYVPSLEIEAIYTMLLRRRLYTTSAKRNIPYQLPGRILNNKEIPRTDATIHLLFQKRSSPHFIPNIMMAGRTSGGLPTHGAPTRDEYNKLPEEAKTQINEAVRSPALPLPSLSFHHV
jgi:hypothetical protein